MYTPDYRSRKLITTDIILDAIAGDSIAMRVVLKHYNNYILKFSLRKDDKGSLDSNVYVDEFTRRRLETKLIEKVMTFDPNR